MTESVMDHTLEALMAIPDGSLKSVAELYPYFGAKTESDLADAMVAQFGYDEATKVAKKVNVMQRVFFDVKLVDAKHRRTATSNSTTSGLTEATLAVGGGMAAEAVHRATELLNGSEQTFDGMVDFDVVLDALRTKFSATGFSFRPVVSRADDTRSCEVLDERSNVLLTFSIRNEFNPAPIEETLFDGDTGRQLGSCHVIISKSNVRGMFDAIIEDIEDVDVGVRSHDLADGMAAVLKGFDVVSGALSRADLPQKIAKEIATIALQAAEKQKAETQEIRARNEGRAAEIKSGGLECPYCGTQRTGDERNCAACGSSLSAMAGSREQIQRDKQLLSQRGFSFS